MACMTWCEILINVIICILTGLLSSWVVTRFYQKKIEKVEKREKFLGEQQQLSRYLQTLDHYITSDRSAPNFDELTKVLINEPLHVSFELLSEVDKVAMLGFAELIADIGTFAKQDQKSDSEVNKLHSRIFHMIINILKLKYPN